MKKINKLLKAKMGNDDQVEENEQDQNTNQDDNTESTNIDNNNVNDEVESLKAELESQRATKEAILKEKRDLEAALKEAKKVKKTQEIQDLKERGENEKALELELVEAQSKLAELTSIMQEQKEKEQQAAVEKKEALLKDSITSELGQFESFNQDATEDVLILIKSIFNDVDEKTGKAIGYDGNGNLIKNKKGAAYTVTDFLNENVEKRSYLFKQHQGADQKASATSGKPGSLTREQFRISLAKISGKDEREKFIRENKDNII